MGMVELIIFMVIHRGVMIRLTYSQVMGFNSPVISKLLSSDDRRFPTDDAIRLADIIGQVQPKIKLFQEQARKAIEICGGELDEKGAIKFISEDIRKKIEVELANLNAVEVEITGDHLKKAVNWPDLSIQEAMILKPLFDRGEYAEGNGEGA